MTKLAVAPVFRPYQQADYPRLLGGLHDSIADEFIEVSELSSVQNYIPDPINAGLLAKRPGTVQVSSQQSDPFTSIHYGMHDIWATTNTGIINDAGADQSVVLTNVADPDWATLRSQSYDMVANGNEFQRYNGSVWAAVGGTPPAFTYIEGHNNFVFGAGHSAGTVRWSALGNADSWPASNAWTLAGTARGLIKHRNVLFFFTDLGFHHLRGTAERGIAITYSGGPGTTSHRSLVSAGGLGLFWWSDEGMMWSPDGFESHSISRLKISDEIEGLNGDQFDIVHGAFNDRFQSIEYYVASTGSSTIDRAIFYFPRVGVRDIEGIQVGSFWIGSGVGVEMGASGRVLVSGDPQVYVGSAASNGYLYNRTGATDDGTAISAFLETQRNSSEFGPDSEKFCKYLIPEFFVSGTSQILVKAYHNSDQSTSQTWTVNLSGGGFVLDTSALDVDQLDGGDTPNEPRLAYKQNWRKLKLRIEDSSSVQTKIARILNRGYVVST